MEEKEKKELITKILNADNDPRMSRVAVTVFINKATQEEARYFLDYLNHHSPAVKKIARSIVGQKTILEALKPLLREFYNVVGPLNFMPGEEYKESHYYPNLIEILETIFNICKEKCTSDIEFYTKIVQIFKNTRNEDLRFTLIKLLGLMGGQFNYFLEIYNDMTEKERRALYYVYTIVEEPGRLKIYKKGLEDDRNFDYVISHMLSFEQGRLALSETLLSLDSIKKQTVLKKLLQTEGKYPGFNNVLIKLLSDKNKFLAELAIENLKASPSFLLELDPLIEEMETGHSPRGIRAAMEIIAHFDKKNLENIYLKGLEKQPSFMNKHVILEFFFKELKHNIRQTGELTEKLLPQLLVYFDDYSNEKEELLISIFKILPALKFPSRDKIRALKQKIITFEQEFEQQLSDTLRDKLDEFLVKIGQLAGRFEEAESKSKNINAQKTIKKIEERNEDEIQSVLILEPLFYIRKKLNEFFKSQAFRVFNLKEVERFNEIFTKLFRFLVISDSLLDEEFTRQVFDYMDTNLDTILIIVTANPDNLDIFKEIPNIRFLKKPFNDDRLQEVIVRN
jgi:hypothetical protein